MNGQTNGFWKSHLFIFLMGQLMAFIIGVIFFAIGWGKLSQQFVESMEWRNVTQARMERMDKEGTNAAKYGMDWENKRMDGLEQRENKLEDDTRKIDVMKEKIDRLEAAKR